MGDCSCDNRVKEAFNSLIESMERNQHPYIILAIVLGRFLKGAEHRPFPFCQVLARKPCFSDPVKDLLHKVKLVGDKRIYVYKVVFIFVDLYFSPV
ncbi:hypothetical protein DSECCO2_599300 [anaerobic digester metagenome]